MANMDKDSPQLLYNFCNSNKKHPICAKFCINNASSIGKQSAKFQLNLPKQTIVMFLWGDTNTSVLGFCGLRQTQTLELFRGDLTKTAITIVCFGTFIW